MPIGFQASVSASKLDRFLQTTVFFQNIVLLYTTFRWDSFTKRCKHQIRLANLICRIAIAWNEINSDGVCVGHYEEHNWDDHGKCCAIARVGDTSENRGNLNITKARLGNYRCRCGKIRFTHAPPTTAPTIHPAPLC